MQIHDRIKALREAEKISMRQLAKELGVSHNTISKWERNPDKCRSECALPTRDNVLSLARFFKVTPGWLMFGELKYKASRQKIMKQIEELTDSQFRMIAKLVDELLASPAYGDAGHGIGWMLRGTGRVTASSTTNRVATPGPTAIG